MSYLAHEDVQCSACKHPMEAEVWSVINVKEDPELKDILLGGELNMIECEACKTVFYAEHFLLYHDPVNELMAFVYPREYAADREAWERKTKEDFSTSQAGIEENDRVAYAPLTLFGLDELLALVEREEEEIIQGEIAAVLASQYGFLVRRLRPSLARHHRLPAVLPFDDGASETRAGLLAGVDRLLEANDHLSVYSELRARVAADPAFPLAAVAAS